MNLEITLNKFINDNFLMIDGIASIFVCIVFYLTVSKLTKEIDSDDIYLKFFRCWIAFCTLIGFVCGVLKIIVAGA